MTDSLRFSLPTRGLRFDQRTMSVCLLLIATGAIWCPIMGIEGVTPDRVPEILRDTHAQVCVFAIVAIAGLTATAARRDSEGELILVTQELERRVDARTAQVRQSEERLRELLESLPDSILLIDSNGAITRVNQRATHIFGYSGSEFAELKLSHLTRTNDSLLRSLAEGEADVVRPAITQLRRKDGTWFPAEVMGRWVNLDGARKILAIPRDISHRSEMERRLNQSEKMSLLGMLTGGIAHDFNNVLAGILGHADLARDDISPGSRAEAHLTEVVANVERARSLVEDIFSTCRDPSEAHRTDACQVAREVLNLLQPMIPSSINAELFIEDHTLEVNADRTQLHRLLMNLCTNSIHAMREIEGQLAVRIARYRPTVASNPFNVAISDYISIGVHDEGHGMDDDTIARVFDPFYTTKRTREGTGLGLPVVQSIIRQMQGAVRITSQVGVGTDIALLIPAVSQTITPSPSQRGGTATQGARRAELLVASLHNRSSKALTELVQLGYSLVRQTSSDAVDTLRRDPTRFAALVVVAQTPNAGSSLALESRGVDRTLPIVLLHDPYCDPDRLGEARHLYDLAFDDATTTDRLEPALARVCSSRQRAKNQSKPL